MYQFWPFPIKGDNDHINPVLRYRGFWPNIQNHIYSNAIKTWCLSSVSSFYYFLYLSQSRIIQYLINDIQLKQVINDIFIKYWGFIKTTHKMFCPVFQWKYEPEVFTKDSKESNPIYGVKGFGQVPSVYIYIYIKEYIKINKYDQKCVCKTVNLLKRYVIWIFINLLTFFTLVPHWTHTWQKFFSP